MKVQQISFEKTEHFPKLFLDYVNREEKLRSFYKYSPEISSFTQAIKDISSHKFNRKLLVDVISEQYIKANIQLPTSNIQSLFNENTFTVCTGHQLCLFTGPLYFIYKIISTINLAERLNLKSKAENLKSVFVPVYWMASEDHDFEEINHANVFGKKIEWKNKQGGAVGKYLNDGIKEIITEMKTVLGESKNANELTELFESAYTKHADYSSATRYLVNELFGQYGLVIIDPDDIRLKKEFADIMSDDLFNSSAFNSTTKTINNLEKNGYKSQVNPREINLFYLINNQRNRIIKENDKFNIVDMHKSFTENELKEELKSYPERFSPNVVLRPLYQQKILPNLAYVGGPAEISYWLEYKEMFDNYGIFFPVLIPRNFVMIIDEQISERLTKLGLSSEDVFLPINEMTEKFIKSISGEKISLESEKKSIAKLYNDISEKASLVDASLVNSVKAGLQKNMEEIENFEKKMLRSFKQRNETAVGQIEKIKSKLFPNNVLQERFDNFIPFYLKRGKRFIEVLRENLDPLDFRFTILSEKE